VMAFSEHPMKVLSTIDWTISDPVERSGVNSTALCTAFSPDGQYLAISTKNQLQIRYSEDWYPAAEIEGVMPALAFTPDNQLLAWGSNYGTIEILSMSEWVMVRTLDLNNPSYTVKSIRFSPDGLYLIVVSSVDEMQLWTTIDWVKYDTSQLAEGKQVTSASFSPDSQLLALGLEDSIKIYNTSDWSEVTELFGHSNTVYSIDFTPDMMYLVSGSFDFTVKTWSTKDWSEVQNTGELD